MGEGLVIFGAGMFTGGLTGLLSARYFLRRYIRNAKDEMREAMEAKRAELLQQQTGKSKRQRRRGR